MPLDRKTLNNLRKRLFKSVWLYPGLLLIVLIVLSTFSLSGTSIGIYNDIFYGATKDSSLLFNHPEDIRSDEWIVNSQLTIAQKVAGYPRINPNIDSGRDMTVVGDVPIKDWSTAFRPQNLAFFVLPFQQAFAFKWWLLLYMTIVSCYFFVLRIFKKKRLFAALFSTAIGLSPFIFWWYQTGTLAPIFYGFLIILLSFRIINSERSILLKNKSFIYSQIVYALILSYLLVCFTLVLYPPFQIPIAIVLFFVVAGLLLNTYGLSQRLFSLHALKKIAVFGSGILIAIFLILTFILTRQSAIHAITHSVYPGNRPVLTEGNSFYEITSTFLQPQLQRTTRAAHYYTNQSEASNFILLLPFLFLPAFFVLFLEYKKFKKIDWPLLSVQLAISLFLAYLFIPFLSPLYKVFLLNKVANVRLYIGLGFVGVIQMLLLAKAIDKLKIKTKLLDSISGIYCVLCLIFLLFVGQYTRTTYPGFIHNIFVIGVLALIFSIILFCFLSNRLMIGAIFLLIFSFGSVFRIHPLYHGMGPVYNNSVIEAIDKVSKPGDSWAVLDSLHFENFALMANRDSLSGIKPYPDLSFWRQVGGSRFDNVYNRYAHVIFIDDKLTSSKLRLISPDNFQVQFTCTPFIEKNAHYALALHELSDTCVHLLKQIHYPNVDFYLYKVR